VGIKEVRGKAISYRPSRHKPDQTRLGSTPWSCMTIWTRSMSLFRAKITNLSSGGS